MPSLLSRLRSRAVSLSSELSTSSTATPASPSGDVTPSTSSVLTTPYPSPVNRKIHPNLDSLLEDYSAQLEQESDLRAGGATGAAEFGISLKPSQPRTQTRLSTSRPLSPSSTSAVPGTLDEFDEITEPTASTHEPHTTDPDPEEDVSRSQRILNRISYLASTSEWSTFGRIRDRASPRLDFGHQSPETQHSRLENSDFVAATIRPSRSSTKRKGPGSNASSERSESIGAGNRSATTSHPSDTTAPEVPSTTTSRKSSFKRPESQGHDARTPDSKSISSSRKNHTATTPHRARSNTTSSAGQDIAFDSPRTFGYPTPPEQTSGFTFGFGFGSSPPPLPPLNHPELTAALRAKSGTKPVVPPLSDPALSAEAPQDGDDTIFKSTHDRTFPQRSRPGIDDSVLASLPSFSFRNLRSRSKSSSALPKAQQIFTPSSPPTAHDSARAKASSGKQTASRPRTRARTRTSTVSERRTSADWSAKEATSGDQFSWPAQVSREILRLSFEPFRDGTPSGQEPVSRGQHVGVAQGNIFSPATSSHILPPSESLGSPFTEGAGGLVNNLSDNRGHDLFSMEGKMKATMPTSAPQNTSDGKKNTGKGKAEERRATPSPPKKRSSPSRSSQANSGLSSSLSSRPTTLSSGPLPVEESVRAPSGRSASEPGPSDIRVAATPMRQTASSSSTVSKGKRKAEDVDGTPPDQKKEPQRATFSIPPDPRPHRASATSSSHAPSSYHRKRPRLSNPSTLTSPPESSLPHNPDAGNTGSLASRASSTRPSLLPRSSSRAASRAASTRSNPAEKEKVPRSSMSQVSIPISALISPHAPSLGRSSTFHMSDPTKPPRRQPTGWSLRFGTQGEPGSGSPLHAWCFFIGFILFPVWWVASFWSTPKTRHVGGTDVEKAVTLDDPQVEHDAKSWRLRCRIMSVVSLVTYIPFIVLVVIFVPS